MIRKIWDTGPILILSRSVYSLEIVLLWFFGALLHGLFAIFSSFRFFVRVCLKNANFLGLGNIREIRVGKSNLQHSQRNCNEIGTKQKAEISYHMIGCNSVTTISFLTHFSLVKNWRLRLFEVSRLLNWSTPFHLFLVWVRCCDSILL